MVWSAHVSMLFRELPYLERPEAATGAGFGTTANTEVRLNGVAVPAASIASVTGTQIVYVAPAHAAGAGGRVAPV